MDGNLWDFGGTAARVDRTGLAVVHEGELVLPAAGSEAEASVVMASDRTVINYYFPVEVEVRGAASVRDPRSVIERALLKVASGLENL
jgi:hypothetical protein